MAERQSSDTQPLDEVMLAMDVVDTLRHSQRLVERELDTEHREQVLLQKLRDIYASQGIAVPDHILAEGVAALREERFTYKPLQPSLAVTLARLYVNRVKWARPMLIGVTVLLVALAAYQFGSQGLRRYRLEQQKAVASAAQAQWEDFVKSGPDAQARVIGEAIYQRAQTALQRGDSRAAQTQLALLTDLQQLQAALAAVVAEAKVTEATTQAQHDYAEGLTALSDGDGERTQAAATRLATLRPQLEQEYTLRIVSRPGEPSGVWRIPEQNPQARNYYLIVEAVGLDGQAHPLSVTSEEDGTTSPVSKWGIRVSEQVFARVRADKQDDGIIQNRQVGVKRRGFLHPEYTIPTSGGMITSW
jgi:hypothetical protein